jgi:MoaA/NifB/PqqE/SkfB family radical SAM enzyme
MARKLGSEIVRYLGKMAKGEPFTPAFVTFFVTNKCDCRCEHCFYWEDLNTKNDKELKLEEIQEMSRHMDDILYLTIGGGEPYLRKDLADIIETFYKHNNLHSVVIPTNAQWTDNTLEVVERVMTNCPDLRFSTTISLDAIGELYDHIRGKKNCYERAMMTHEALKPLRKKYENFSVRMCQTIMQQNQDVAEQTYEHKINYLKPDMVNIIYIRGNPLVPDSKEFDMGAYERLKARMAEDMKNGRWVNHKPTDPGRHILNALDDMVHDLIYETERTQKAQFTCQAGNISCVIYPDGNLVECETKNTVYGNLREVGMDFRKLWFSERAKEIRAKVTNGCFCTHETSCMYPSIPMTPKLFPKLMAKSLKHKWYDVKNQAHKDDKIGTATPAHEAPGYAEYESKLATSVRRYKLQQQAQPAAESSACSSGVEEPALVR